MRLQTILAGAAFAAGLAWAASAGAATVTGSIVFDGSSPNGYDPANGNVPAGYSNASGTRVTIPGDFAYLDSYNFDTAVFTTSQLTLSDATMGFGALPWEQTFTASSAKVFSSTTLTGGDFTGLTWAVSGKTLTVGWAGTYAQGLPFTGSYSDTFSLSAVPEPTSWGLMLVGLAGLGGVIRQARRSAAALG